MNAADSPAAGWRSFVYDAAVPVAAARKERSAKQAQLRRFLTGRSIVPVGEDDVDGIGRLATIASGGWGQRLGVRGTGRAKIGSFHHEEFIMSVRTVADKFVELCRQGKNFDVMRTMYAPDIISVEGDGKETAGQEAVIQKSADWVSDKTFHGETVAGPFFNGANPDQFVVFFTLDITPNATGQRIAREEVAVYTVQDDQITREQFFYDGAH